MTETYHILYDQACGLCRTTRRVLATLGTESQLCYWDLNNPSHVSRFPRISSEQARRSVHVVDPAGNISAGYDAMLVLLSQTHLLRPFVGLLRRPGFARIGRRVYGFISRHRHQLLS